MPSCSPDCCLLRAVEVRDARVSVFLLPAVNLCACLHGFTLPPPPPHLHVSKTFLLRHKVTSCLNGGVWAETGSPPAAAAAMSVLLALGVDSAVIFRPFPTLASPFSSFCSCCLAAVSGYARALFLLRVYGIKVMPRRHFCDLHPLFFPRPLSL